MLASHEPSTLTYMETAAVQLRVSQDPSGDVRSIDNHRRAAQATCKAHGWVYGTEYVETISASEFGEAKRLARAKPQSRDEFERLLTDLATGQFSVLLVSEVTRSTRDIEHLGRLAKVCARAGVKLCVGDRVMDLSESADFTLVAIEGVLGQAEAKRLSKRSLRGHEGARAEGRPPAGTTPFGYLRPPREIGTRAFQVPHPVNGGLVRWAVVDAIPNGWSLRAVADVWAAAPGATKTPTRTTVRQSITNPAIIGLRPRLKDDPIPGNWESLVNVEEFARCVEILSEPSRRRPDSAKTLLSAIATCAACGLKIATSRAPEGRRYRCNKGHCSRSIDEMDTAAVEALKTELRRVTLLAVRGYAAREPEKMDSLATATEAYEEAQRRLNEFRGSWVRQGFSSEDAAEAIKQYRADVDAARSAIPDDQPALPGTSLFDQAVHDLRSGDWGDVEIGFAVQMWVNNRWSKMSLNERRALMRTHLTIQITGKKNPLFDKATNGIKCTPIS